MINFGTFVLFVVLVGQDLRSFCTLSIIYLIVSPSILSLRRLYLLVWGTRRLGGDLKGYDPGSPR